MALEPVGRSCRRISRSFRVGRPTGRCRGEYLALVALAALGCGGDDTRTPTQPEPSQTGSVTVVVSTSLVNDQSTFDANGYVVRVGTSERTVSANDSAAYARQFAPDAVRLPPGGKPEHGPEEIARSEQKDYDVASWSVQSRPLDALWISDDWVYGIAEADVSTVAHADQSSRSFRVTKTWLLQRQPSGQWLIKRQMWNLK